MRRLALVPVVLVIALVVALPAGASPARIRVVFSSRGRHVPICRQERLLNGSGIESSITIERTNANGVTTTINVTHTHGTSTDQDGNVYVFDYSNEFRVSNTVADPATFTGMMTDHFSNSGMDRRS